MVRKSCTRTSLVALVSAALTLALFLPGVRAQTSLAEKVRALFSGPAETVAPAGLPLPMGESERGEPEAVDPALMDELRRVMTDPGCLPQLEVQVDGEKRVLPLEHTHVSAEVSGFVARVEVTQRYRNPLEVPIEAIYVFPLPENSAVDDMKVRIGERLIEAEIQRRAEARATYEEARRAGHTAALLEQERPNVFTQSIANMAPGEDIEVIVRYVQDLSYDSGEYEFVFPMVVGPRFFPPGAPTGGRSGSGWARDTSTVPDASRVSPPIMGGGRRTGHDISLEIVLAEGLEVQDLRVPTHAVEVSQVDGATVVELSSGDTIPNRDFVLRYAVDEPAPHGALYTHRADKGGFFSLVLQPPTLDVDAEVGRRELIFVIDVSGSMWGRPIAMAKDAARQAIRRLRPVDTFNVITFAGATAKAFPSPREGNTTNIREGLDFIEKAQAGGGTMLANAVAEALKTEVEDGRDRYVIFLTDGYVGNEAEIHSMTRKFVAELGRKGHRARAFGFGIGSSVNRHLLDGIGKAGQGATVYLTNREDPELAVRAAFRLLDAPVMTDLEIDWDGLAIDDVQPTVLPDLLASRPLILHGRYTKAGEGRIVVKGRANGRTMRVEIPVVLPEREERNGALATLWARARIESLSRALWDGPDKEVVERITETALAHRLVSAYTSFVAVDRSRKVGDGDPLTVVQPVEAPEGVDPAMAAPAAALTSGMRTRGGGGMSYGGLSGKGMGAVARVGRLMPPPAAVARLDSFAGAEETADEHPASELEDGGDRDEAEKKAEAPARMSVRVLRAEGPLPKSVIAGLVQSRRAELLAAGAKGRLVLRLVIAPDGRVSLAEKKSGAIADATVLSRLLTILRGLSFPAQDKGTTAIVALDLK